MKAFGVALVAALAAAPAAGPADVAQVVHTLNRITFGATAGDVERVRAIGIDRYIDQQLHPERIDDSAMRQRLQPLVTLTMSSRQLAEQYEQPLLEARRQRKDSGDDPAPAQQMAQRAANGVLVELSQQKILRAVYGERQLEEVLTDFWFNHFNVDARKGPERFLLTEYERDVIRPHVFGKFRDLLGATAKSPAMLFYLDNWISVDPNAPALINRRQPQQSQRRGLNENYARELMELHTLGVDGGYTQKDVTEVARAFTGWSIDRPRDGGEFAFSRACTIVARRLCSVTPSKPAAAKRTVNRCSTSSPNIATSTFIATKLVRRFVSDVPPATLVDRVAARFRDTGGDLREGVRTILSSKEFRAADAVNAKAKTPFEFLVSALRTAGTDIRDGRPYVRTMQELGMPLYQCQPPTGYADTADAWINTGALVARMNVATRIAAGDPELALKLGSPEFQRR
jgi:Uncharacterized protein conserved in bacteria